MAVEFKLFAPRNQKVALVGSFSDWQEIAMQKGEDGYFRTNIDLEDNEYQYKFRVQSNSPNLKDQWVELNDPYMTEMDLQTETGVVRIKEGNRISDTYVWQHDNASLPSNEELIIYEMHITDFCGEGVDLETPNKFKQAVKKLDYLSDLGTNAIALMPLTEYAGNYRWGYSVRYFFALESSYGKPEDLKHFVDECHVRNIRVFLDGIYNHTDDHSPLLKIDRDYWYYHDRHYPDDDANYWGPEFNYDNYDETRNIRPTWEFVRDVVQFWIHEYHLDGIRYDAVRQLNNYDFFQWLFHQIESTVSHKPFYQIAEHIPDTADICKPNGMFDGCWHESFRYFLKDALLGESVDRDEFKNAIAAQPQGYAHTTSVINYLASHDREHMIVELGDQGIFDQAASDRVKLGAILQFTSPGIPMLWMGDEFAQPTHKAEQTTEPNPLDWSLLDHEFNQDLLTFYKHLIALRKQQSSLRTENIEFFHEHPDHPILAYVRWNDSGERVVVVANFSDQSFDHYELPHFPADGTWRKWLSDEQITAKDKKVVITLPNHTALILLQT